MNQEIKAKWLEALRSGKYQQTRKVLRDSNGYCCLGVLCDVMGVEWVKDDGCFLVLYDNGEGRVGREAGMPPSEIMREAKLDELFAGVLAEGNDAGDTFAELAARIEERA